MPELGYIGDFGVEKGGLLTVERAWLDASRVVIGSWASVSELQADSGIYYLFEDAPGTAKWIVWRTGEANQLYILSSLVDGFAVFNYGALHTGKSLAYQYLDENNVAIGAEITADVEEYEDSGVYVAFNVTIPALAVFVRVRTIEANPVYLAFSIDSAGLAFQTGRKGPYVEEVPL